MKDVFEDKLKAMGDAAAALWLEALDADLREVAALAPDHTWVDWNQFFKVQLHRDLVGLRKVMEQRL